MTRHPLRRRGYTLIEMSIAGLIAAVVITAVMSMLVSGSRLFSSGQNAVRGPEAAILVMDHLERDIIQALQVPGDPRPPVAIDEAGETIAFYIPGAEDAAGLYHPARNGEVLKTVALLSWEFTLWSPKYDEGLPGWYVTVRLRFQADNLRGEPYVYARAIHLSQPSTNYASFPTFGDDLNPGLVRLLSPPELPAFDAIRPPERGDLIRPDVAPEVYFGPGRVTGGGVPVEELP